MHAALPVINLVSGGEKDRYLEGAIKEMRQEEDPAFQFILYGHTHVARQEYLNGELDGRGRLYVNTGTYLLLITLARDGRTFGSAKQMTMTFAYGEDEDTDGKPGPVAGRVGRDRRKQYAGGRAATIAVPGHQLGGPRRLASLLSPAPGA